jgi:RES domain-containing protein
MASTRNVITAWRLVKARLANQAFTGEGSRLYGGRWNSPGIPVIYTSATASLAVLEVFANVQHSDLLSTYMLVSCSFDEHLLRDISINDLPSNWRKSPAPQELQALGDDWIKNSSSVALRVPSAIIELESNYLLNPLHVDFRRVKLSKPEPFRFDLRLLT